MNEATMKRLFGKKQDEIIFIIGDSRCQDGLSSAFVYIKSWWNVHPFQHPSSQIKWNRGVWIN